MLSVTTDDVRLLKDLAFFIEPVEVYDPQGKLLGLFVPANLERGKELKARAAAQIDWAEIERRRQSGEKGDPFEVVKDRLRLLELEAERRRAAGEKDMTPEEVVAFMDRLRRQGQTSGHPSAANGPARRKTDALHRNLAPERPGRTGPPLDGGDGS